MRFLCEGEVVSVASDVRSLGGEDPNSAYAIVKFSSGATGILQTNWACGRRFFTIEMHALGISAYVDPDECGMLYKDGELEGERFDTAESASGDSLWRKMGFYDENRHFIDCVKSRKQPSPSLAETVGTMELVDRIYHCQV
jgi:predicted dehydrogenase